MTREEFISYLRGTLIPNLCEDGKMATATDFEIACQFIENPTRKEMTCREMEDVIEDYPCLM